MGIFDFLRKPGPEEALRDLLFQAVARGDAEALEAACREHGAEIVAAFPSWKTVPPEVRRDAARVSAYAALLMAIARCMADRLGLHAPLEELVGTPETNPVLRWQAALEETRRRMDEAKYAEAAERLSPLAEEIRGATGSAVASLLPIVLGWLGECRFQVGDAAGAIAPTEEALRLCEEANDAQGARAHLGSLCEFHRYLGKGAEAASRLDRLAELSDAEAADFLRARATLLRAGEPVLRVTLFDGKREHELDALAKVPEGKLDILYRRDRPSLRPCLMAVERGRELGSKGKFQEALAEFERAAKLDPHDPDPPYLAGLTLLHLDRYVEAVRELERVEQLAPGWFHSRSDLWLARGLAMKRVERGTFLAVRVSEDGEFPPAEKLELLDAAVGKAPKVPMLHLHRAEQLRKLGRAKEAEAACRAGLALEADDETRTRLLGLLAMTVGGEEERRGLFEQAAALSGHLVVGAMATLALRRDQAK